MFELKLNDEEASQLFDELVNLLFIAHEQGHETEHLLASQVADEIAIFFLNERHGAGVRGPVVEQP